MPRPNPPPTPGSSADLTGKEGELVASAINLPPTAYHDPDRAGTSSSTPSSNGSDSSYRPGSPKSEKLRSTQGPQSGAVITKDDFTLPPPPTRSRKIIQMKPRETEDHHATPPTARARPDAAGRTQSASSQAGKRKQNISGQTAAGRKVARKTAHSLIERRRRSKMNEEFGVLKDMIPACKGQEMHKLAILSASIEYLRYLEQCVADLQAQNSESRSPPPFTARARDVHEDDDDDDDGDERNDNDDEEMQDPPPASTPPNSLPQHEQNQRTNSLISLPSLSQITSALATTTSPSTFSANGADRHYSLSSAASQASYSPYIHSNQTSPTFGPQLSYLHYSGGAPQLGLGSPALGPVDAGGSTAARRVGEGGAPAAAGEGRTKDRELDREAAKALSMLNHDRRGWRPAEPGVGAVRGRGSSSGMSVRELLSG